MEIHKNNLTRLGAMMHGSYCLNMDDEPTEFGGLDVMEQEAWEKVAQLGIEVVARQLDEHMNAGVREYDVLVDGEVKKMELLNLNTEEA